MTSEPENYNGPVKVQMTAIQTSVSIGPIEQANKEHACLGWFPAFGPHPARWWNMRYSFIAQEWHIQIPFTNWDGRQIDAEGFPQPTHYASLPSAPVNG